MTRFEKWVAKKVEKWLAKQTNVNIICHADCGFCKDCIVRPICDKYNAKEGAE